jgi:hypothetical protein
MSLAQAIQGWPCSTSPHGPCTEGPPAGLPARHLISWLMERLNPEKDLIYLAATKAIDQFNQVGDRQYGPGRWGAGSTVQAGGGGHHGSVTGAQAQSLRAAALHAHNHSPDESCGLLC